MSARYYIPEEVHFYLQAEEKILSMSGARYKARPAFPVSSRSVDLGHKVVQTAERWARDHYGNPAHPPTVLILKNIPKSGYRLTDLVARAEGGRAGKVITPEGFYVDLREDVFTHVLFTKGIPADGLLDVELQWVQNASQMRLDIPGSPGFKKYTPESELG